MVQVCPVESVVAAGTIIVVQLGLQPIAAGADLLKLGQIMFERVHRAENSGKALELKPQEFADVGGKSVVDFVVARDRLLFSIGGILKNIVAGAVPQQYAPCLRELADKILPLHKAISLTRYCSGTSSMAISR